MALWDSEVGKVGNIGTVASDGDAVVALLQYKHTLRQLHHTAATHQATTKQLSDLLLHTQRHSFATKQRHNAALSAIQHQRGRRFDAVCVLSEQVPAVACLLQQQQHEREAVLLVLKEEIASRTLANQRLAEKQAEYTKHLQALQATTDKQRELRQKLQAWLSTGSDLFKELKGDTGKADLRVVFEACCGEEAPCWEQLRFFPAHGKPHDDPPPTLQQAAHQQDEDDTRNDPLFKPSLSHTDHLRFRLTDQLTVTATAEPNITIRLDAVEYKWTEEEAAEWLKALLDNDTVMCTPSDLRQALQKIKQTYKDEQDLFDECHQDGPFKHLQRPSHHHYTFTVSDPQNAAIATVTTSPRRHWHLLPTTPDEAFTTRCRLVQERLNHADMAVAPIALQLAFLRKLVS